jgi:hypothetical protein
MMNTQDAIDILSDELDCLPRDERDTYYGVEVYRQAKADPDGWEFCIGNVDGLTAQEAARKIVESSAGYAEDVLEARDEGYDWS